MAVDRAPTARNVSHSEGEINTHAVFNARKAFPARRGTRKYPASIDSCRCVFAGGYYRRSVSDSRETSLEVLCESELFRVGVTSSAGPGGCDHLSSWGSEELLSVLSHEHLVENLC